MPKSFLIYGCFSLVTSGIGFVTVPLLSHFFSKEDFGIIGLFMIVMQLFTPIVGLSMNSIISRSYYLRNDLNELLGSAFYIVLLLTSLMLVLLLLIPEVIFASFGFGKELALIALLAAFFMIISATLLAILQMEERPIQWGIATLVNTVVSVALTFLLIILFEFDYISRLLGILIGQMLAAFVAYFFIRQFISIRFTINEEHFRYFISFGLPLVFSALSGWALISVDRVFIESLLGIEVTGVYVFAVTLASPVLIIQTTYTRVWSPRAFRMLANKQEKQLLKRLLYSYFGYIIVGLLFSYSAPYFYQLVISKEFYDSLLLLPWLIAGIVIQGVQSLILPYIMNYGKTKILAYTALLAVGVNVFCNYFLIPEWKLIGAAVATIISNFVISALYIYYVFKNYDFYGLKFFHSWVSKF